MIPASLLNRDTLDNLCRFYYVMGGNDEMRSKALTPDASVLVDYILEHKIPVYATPVVFRDSDAPTRVDQWCLFDALRNIAEHNLSMDTYCFAVFRLAERWMNGVPSYHVPQDRTIHAGSPTDAIAHYLLVLLQIRTGAYRYGAGYGHTISMPEALAQIGQCVMTSSMNPHPSSSYYNQAQYRCQMLAAFDGHLPEIPDTSFFITPVQNPNRES